MECPRHGELRKRGLVTAVIYSGPFEKLGSNQAKTFGVPELPLLKIPHPLGGLALQDVTARATRPPAVRRTRQEEHVMSDSVN